MFTVFARDEIKGLDLMYIFQCLERFLGKFKVHSFQIRVALNHV